MWKGRSGNYFSLSVVMAAFNESRTITQVITGIKILKIVDKIILVDDSSTDDTADIAKRMDCEVIKNNTQIGQTRSLRRGIIATDTDLIITIDADMDHFPSAIPRLIASMEEQSADIVISGRSVLPRISEIIMSKIICNTTGVTDTISGFRLISRRALNQVEFDNDDTWGSLFLIRCAKKGLKIIEISVEPPPQRLVTRTGGRFRSNIKILRALGMDILCIIGLI